MHRFFSALSVTIFLLNLISISSPVFATTTAMTLPELGMLDQHHHYSLYLRGNGEAVVSVKVRITNYTDTPIYTMKYTLPAETEIYDVSAFQVKTPGSQPCYYPTPVPYDMVEPAVEQPCSYSGYYSNIYDVAGYRTEGNTLTIELPTPIHKQEKGDFLFTYRTYDYVQKNIYGTYAYTFDSLKSDRPIASMQVGISTEDDLILRGAVGQVQYRSSAVSMPVEAGVSIVPGGNNQQMDMYYSQIGYGAIHKTASMLASNESYAVKGKYADSLWKVYATEIFVGLLVFEILVIVGYTGIRFLSKSSLKGSSMRMTRLVAHSQRPLLFALILSTLSSFSVIAYTIFLLFITRILETSDIYYYGSGWIIHVLLVIISIGMYLIFLFTPAIFMGIKRNIFWGIATFSMTICGIIFLTITTTFVLYSITPKLYSDPDHLYRVTPYSGSAASPVIQGE